MQGKRQLDTRRPPLRHIRREGKIRVRAEGLRYAELDPVWVGRSKILDQRILLFKGTK